MSAIKNFIRDMYNWFVRQSQIIKATLIVFFTYASLLFIFMLVRFIMGGKSDQLMLPYNKSNKIITENISNANIPVLGDSDYSKVLKLQDNIINLRREHHYQLSMIFFKNYYGVTVCLMLISCIGGLLLFVLINRGWSGSSYSVKVFFIVFATAAIFFTLFSGVFDQQKNFEDNMLRYMNYTKAELLISQQLSELSKKDYPKKTIADPAKDFSKISAPNKYDSIPVVDTFSYYKFLDSVIAKNNTTINGFTDYILTIDASKMKNIGDVYQTLINLKSMNTDSTKHK